MQGLAQQILRPLVLQDVFISHGLSEMVYLLMPAFPEVTSLRPSPPMMIRIRSIHQFLGLRFSALRIMMRWQAIAIEVNI